MRVCICVWVCMCECISISVCVYGYKCVLVLVIFIMLAVCEINSRALLTNSTFNFLGCGVQPVGHSGVEGSTDTTLHIYFRF